MKALLIVFILIKLNISDNNILCPKNYCETISCSAIPDKCKIQNATHNGIFLPSPEFCNCCDFCLENIGEGEPCAEGESGGRVPNSICGPLLSCQNGICQRMNTVCTQAQDDFDERRKLGTLGNMEKRPECDRNGNFVSYKCVPGQNCFCVGKDGNRIFGEAAFTTIPNFLMKCPCARFYHEFETKIGRPLGPHEHFRCLENGDYDPIQCIENDCFCVDAQDGTPTFPDANSVKIHEISNETLPCFNSKIHKPKQFYHECSSKYLKTWQHTEALKNDGYDLIFDINFPKCSMDGKYAPVQENSTHFYCAFTNGKIIENYGIPKTDPSAFNINCKCARTELLSPNKPKCCSNGNFHPIQCRKGFCRCVDDDGYQVEKEVFEDDVEKLSCYLKKC